jgi:hypothetical protein
MLTLHGRVEDEGFLRFLEHATRDASTSFTAGDAGSSPPPLPIHESRTDARSTGY